MLRPAPGVPLACRPSAPLPLGALVAFLFGVLIPGVSSTVGCSDEAPFFAGGLVDVVGDGSGGASDAGPDGDPVDAQDAAGCTEHADCRGGEVCRGGACVPVEGGVCEPGARRCEGDALVVCDETGSRETRVECDTTAECSGAGPGCACEEGACVPRACRPGVRSCEGDSVVECDATGSVTRTVQTCGDDEVCRGGACVDGSCEPGTSSCAGEVRLACSAETGELTETDCAASSSYCRTFDETSAGCVAWECLPGTTSCDRTGTVRVVCDARGTSSELIPCAGDEFCAAGSCSPRVCTPGERICTGGDVHVCASNGSGYALQTDCGTASCVEGTCVGEVPSCTSAGDCPPPRGRCEGNTLVSYTGNGVCSRGACDYEPVTRRTDCAASSRVCSAASAACVTPAGPSCTADTDCGSGRYCVSGTCRQCRSTADCSDGRVCVDGACTTCSCPAGSICDTAGRCVVGDPTRCASDSECQALAVALGASPDGVGCDPVVGCFVRGRCDGFDPVSSFPASESDPFDAACATGATCSTVLDLFVGGTYGACVGCSTRDNSACRAGEVCETPLLDLLGTGPVCTRPGSGSPFPFP